MTINYNLEDILKNDYYIKLKDKIKEDILYGFMQETTRHNCFLPGDIIARIRGEYGYNVSSFISSEKLELVDRFVVSELTSFYICHEYFDLSYDDYKYIKQTDISKIKFKDAELRDFILNIKLIQNGKYQIFSNKISNPKERLLNEFKNEMNSNITNCGALASMTGLQLSEYGFSLPDGVDIKDSGFNFTMLIKNMSFAGRSGDNYQEKWNMDESKFLYDSRSLVSNSMFNTAINSQKRSDTWWIVGFNQINYLHDASSADLANNTVDGKLETYLKPGKNVKHLCTTSQLLASSGSIYDDNSSLYNYNEIVCSKYDGDGLKYQPDYIIYPISANPDAIYSKSPQERFDIAVKAAREFNIPIVFLDLDKIAKHEKEIVDQKITTYKNNPSAELLEEILSQIRMNRSTDYASYLFSNTYITQFIIDCCNEENKGIFESFINIMPDYSFTILQNNLNIAIMDNNRKIEEEYKVKEYEKFEEIGDGLEEEIRSQLEELEQKAMILNKKIIKTKEVKKEYADIIMQIDAFKQSLIESENIKIKQRKSKLFENKEKYEFLYTLSYEKKINIPNIETVIQINNLLENNDSLEYENSYTL